MLKSAVQSARGYDVISPRFSPSFFPSLSLSPYLQVILTFVCMFMKESVEIVPVPYTLQVHRVALDGRDHSNSLRREKRLVQCQLGQYLHPRETHCCMRCHAGMYNKYSNSDLHLRGISLSCTLKLSLSSSCISAPFLW